MENNTASPKNILKNPPVQIILFGIVLCLIQVLSMNGVISSSFAFALGNTLIYAVMAIGFCLLLGYSGLASLGTAGFIGIGTYAVYYIMQENGYPLFLAFLVTLGISLGLGVVVGFISLRIEGIYLAILTLGLSEIIRNVLMAIKPTIKLELANSRLFGIQMNDRVAYFLIVIIYCLLMWVTSNLINSPTGRAMVAMKNSTSAAQAMGISLMKFRLMAFVIATVYAALGGLLYMVYVRNLTTSSSLLLTLTTSLNILGAVIIGGSKSLWGTFVGTFIIYGIQSMFLSRIPFFVKNPAFITMVTGVLIVVVVMFFPGGIAQIASNISASFKKRKLAGAAAAAEEKKGEE
ncbi:MAG: branched-chain amino acid ABC transporter permease [Lachnospiraceae bacterium]|nr:branched-chain amino acid ABC transporter permease [Lachnospiraceae bacterium]